MKSEKDIIKMDIKEFRLKGYLQELNRRFLHPLGLALEIIIDEKDNSEKFGGIWDYRQDAEGMCYDLKVSKKNRIKTFQSKKLFIDSEFESRRLAREKMFGSIIESIDN